MIADATYPATRKLAETVSALSRARRAQAFAGHAWAGLLAGLLCACAAVAAIRVSGVQYPGWTVAAGLVTAGLVASALVAWLRRPSDLEAAIRADLALNLQQQLSTAWEFARGGREPALTEQLAAQATRRRLSARPETIFPLRVNAWGAATPVAAAMLVFVSLLSFESGLPWRAPPAADAVDPLVAAEGARLREFAHAMRTRAERDALPQSARAARKMGALGQRMQGGEFGRETALSRLRDLGEGLAEAHAAALAGDTEVNAGPLEAARLAGSPAEGLSSLRATLEEMLDGRIQPADLQLTEGERRALARAGASEDELEDILERLSGDGREALRRLLDSLDGEDRRMREAEELRKAREEVWRARDNLGEPGAEVAVDAARGGRPAAGEDDALFGALGEFGRDVPADLGDEGMDGAHQGTGAGKSLHGEGEREAGGGMPESERAGTVLRPESQVREGAVFVSQARTLPRVNAANAARVDVEARYAAQMEAVMSKEHYPAHRKAYVRRYFLNLSEGAPAPDRAEGLAAP